MIIGLLHIDMQSLQTQFTGVSNNIKNKRLKNIFDLFTRSK